MRSEARRCNAQGTIPSGLLGGASAQENGHRFWMLFGGVWLFGGASFLLSSAGAFFLLGSLDYEQTVILSGFFAGGVAMTAVGGVIVQRARAAAARDRRLMRDGVELPASVVEVRRSAININREGRWHVRYRYEPSAGQTLEGESRPLPWDAVEGLRPGDPVCIKSDPRQPAESLFLGPAEGERAPPV